MKKFHSFGACLIVLGVFVIFGSLYWETIVVSSESLPKAVKVNHEKPIYLMFLDHVGIAFLSLGILGIILDLPNWQKYFQERLSEVVTQRKYLNTLSKDELIGLQTATLKAFFKVEDIDREGSLLSFFHSRIHDLIASPYRQGVASTVQAEHEPNTPYLRIQESMSYTCHRVGESIQGEITWMPQPEEFCVQNLKVTVGVPPKYVNSHKGTTYDYSALQKLKCGTGYKIPLSDYRDCDGLKVLIEANYLLIQDRFTTWTMTHPTKRFTFTASFPKDLTLIHELFGNIADSEVNVFLAAGLFSASCDDWVLPGSGLVIQFRPIPIPNGPNPESLRTEVESPKGEISKNPQTARQIPETVQTVC